MNIYVCTSAVRSGWFVYLLYNVYTGCVNDLVHSNDIFHFFSQRLMALTAGLNDLASKIWRSHIRNYGRSAFKANV